MGKERKARALESFAPEYAQIWQQMRRAGVFQLECFDKAQANAYKFQFYSYQKALEAAGMESPPIRVSVRGKALTVQFAPNSDFTLSQGLKHAGAVGTPVSSQLPVQEPEDQGPPGWLEIPGKGWFDPDDPSDRLSLIQAGILSE